MKLGIYVHIPFCRQKCLYCDFPSYAGMDSWFDVYCAALRREIAGKSGDFCGAQADTVYLGGGTPSILPAAALLSILQSIRTHFNLAVDAEISMEANPGTVDDSLLRQLRQGGFNRLSLGVQSFDDACLKRIGRIHSADQASMAVRAAQNAGFDNISMDLMYGLPGQRLDQFRQDLEQAVRLNVQHISVYGLKVEEGTPFADMQSCGRLSLPDEDEEAAMYQAMTRDLPAAGYARYEISNFARPGFACRHNLKYWHYEPYLGFGAGAHSFSGQQRYANTADVAEYVQRINQQNDAVTFREALDLPTRMAEYVFLALRTADGVNAADFYETFGVDFFRRYAAAVSQLATQGLLSVTGTGAALTDKGMQFGNEAFIAFLPEDA